MDWQNSDKGVIVVSGSSGLIGTAVINRLAGSYQMIGLDNAGYPFPPITAECVCMDITSDKSVHTAMERIAYAYGNKISSVVHLAAYYDFSGKPSDLYEKITIRGTERLLGALQQFEVEQFIFSSSLLVYQPEPPGNKITEASPVNPKWDYPKSKIKTEKILHTQRGDIPVVNLRIAGVYTNKGNSIPITHQIQRIYEKQLTSHFYPGDVTHGNPFLHLDDLVEAIFKTIEKRKELPGDTMINLGEPETLSYGELQQLIAKSIYHKEWKTNKIAKPLAKAGARLQDIFGDPFIKPWMIDMADDHMEIDISRAKNMLGWRPQHRLKNTLPEIIHTLKNNPEKWYKENKLKK
jgi:nucleoside-diphosphate-sugar epimerase